MPRLQLACKRALDILASAVGLVLLSPLLALTAVVIKLESAGPVLFRQRRAGFRGRPFDLIKFRTMLEARDAQGQPLPDEQRLTHLGLFLRSTSLDEFPELFNVLKGDMCLVGPRPLLLEYLPRYSPDQNRRHEVRPGITGWAQINGRNALTWEEKFAYDVWYVDHQSLWLDLKILALTVWKILRREGISQAGRATMDKFQGSTSSERLRTGSKGQSHI